MPYGYWGKILFVNLSNGKIDVQEPSEEIYRQFLGGYGLGIHYLYQLIPSRADPLGPENVLGFLPGLLTGTGAQFSGRFMVVARSPLTGAWGEANCGGDFGPALRGAGWDGVFVSRQARNPVYLYISEENIEIRDASRLWGQEVHNTEKALREVAGSDMKAACIGPAGENLSLISGIVNHGGRLAARCGLGAVMGSKRLKAVVARGRSHPPLAMPTVFKDAASSYLSLFLHKPSSLSALIPALMSHILPIMRSFHTQFTGGPATIVIDSYRRYGTSAGTAMLVELGGTPVRNWSGISFRDFPLDLSEKLSDKAVIKPLVSPYACNSCPVACGGIVTQPDGNLGHKPEYETLASFGPMTMVSNLDTVMECNHICNMAGLDTISTGGVIAFALECAEKGWLPPELTDELSLKWGDDAVVLELTKRIAGRSPGLGNWLADGVLKAAQSLQPEAREVAGHAGGQELSMHRGLYEPGVAAGYSLDPAPGRHTSTNTGNAAVESFLPYFIMEGCKPAARYDYPGKGITQAISMSLYRAYDSLGLCQFALLMGNPPFLEWVNAVTGWNLERADWGVTIQSSNKQSWNILIFNDQHW